MHKDHLITVEPVAVGWRVALDDLQPLMFLSGAKAEQHAHGLAARLSRFGDVTRVTIHSPTDSVVGSRYAAG